jgi:hypothetical protein
VTTDQIMALVRMHCDMSIALENGTQYIYDEDAGTAYDQLHSAVDRLSRLAAYAESLLQPELEALTALRDTKDAYETMANASYPLECRYIDDIFLHGIKWTHARISAAGITRIREIEELLK